jgi:hypothetical protein
MAHTLTSLTSIIAKSSSESGSHSSGAVNKTYRYMHIVIFIFMARKIQDNGKQNISDRFIHNTMYKITNNYLLLGMIFTM